MRERFNLDEDKAHEQDTITEIQKGVLFRGTNLWILIFAILVCSIGLDVNSTAVIIGAMLISPLMGPIMGIGLGVGINDFNLIIGALKNLGIAVAISVLASAFYFYVSPLHEVRSELLARTSPTLWDVLIALFGGLAGIVAGSRKEKSNAIPGVAIATALMPPLCTAGFGLANGNWEFFFGAFYLFFINSVFISLATYLIVRFLGFKKKQHEKPEREKKVKQYIAIFVILTIIPSVYTAFQVVRKTVFERNASAFIESELDFPNNSVFFPRYIFYPESTIPDTIELTLVGEPVDTGLLREREKRMSRYGLFNTTLIVNQNTKVENVDMAELEQRMNQSIRSDILERLYKEDIQSREEQIRKLEDELLRLNRLVTDLPVEDISRELKAQHPGVEEFSLSKTILENTDSLSRDSIILAYAKFSRKPGRSESKRLEEWLKARTKSEYLKLVID